MAFALLAYSPKLADKSRDQINQPGFYIPCPVIEGARLLPDAGSLVYKLAVRNVPIRNHWDSQSLMSLPRGLRGNVTPLVL